MRVNRNFKKTNPGKVIPFILILDVALMLLFFSGCTSGEPDTAAPERTVIDRTADWQGALLYISDAAGPVPAWGSIRIYDNVSGFVEKTVEQSVAANPSDVYVTRDGGSMYVSGTDNGRIDKFRWDGNNWNRGGVVIDTPARTITSIAAGPDGGLYITADDSGPAGTIYQVNTETDKVEANPVSITALADLRGISWSPDGLTAYLSGNSPEGVSRLVIASWPTLEIKGLVDLPGTSRANRSIVSQDGRVIYVMAEGLIYKLDNSGKTVVATFSPTGSLKSDYAAGTLSADGRYLFATGKAAGEDSTLYIIDLTNESLVKTVKHISDTATGIQRVE